MGKAGDGAKPDKAGDGAKPEKPAGGDMKKYAKAAAYCKGAFRAGAMVAGKTALNIAETEMSCERVWNEMGGEKEGEDGAAGLLKTMGAKVEEAFMKACCGEMKKPDKPADGGAGKPDEPVDGAKPDKAGDGAKPDKAGDGAKPD